MLGMERLKWLLGAIVGYMAVLVVEPWGERDPERGSQPDHTRPPLGVEAWPCPRYMTHTAMRDATGNIWCCACESAFGEGHYLPENTLEA